MKFVSTIGRGLLLSLTTLAIGVWVLSMTLQATIFNRTAVLGWLDSSGAYEHVVSAVVSFQDASGLEDSSGQVAALGDALDKTLTPSYVKESTETGINAVFDWLEGKEDTIEFAIPLAEKREELQKNLAETLAPELKNLPVCQSNFSGISLDSTECLPHGSSADQAAQNAADQVVGDSDFLSEPLTQELLGEGVFDATSQLPAAVQSLGVLAWLLPTLAVITGTGYILLSEDRLRGARRLAGSALFGTVVSAALGATMWLLGSNFKLESVPEGAQEAILFNNVLEPLAVQIVSSIGFWLTVFAGSVALVSCIAWVTLIVIGRKRRSKEEPVVVKSEEADESTTELATTAEAKRADEEPKQDKPVG